MPDVPSLEKLSVPLAILAVEAVLTFLSSLHIHMLISNLKARLSLRTWWNTFWLTLLAFVTLIAGAAMVSPLFVLAQIPLAMIVAAFTVLLWPRISHTLSTGALSQTIWGGVIAIIGLVVSGVSLRNSAWGGMIPALIMGAAGAWMLVDGVQKMAKGE